MRLYVRTDIGKYLHITDKKCIEKLHQTHDLKSVFLSENSSLKIATNIVTKMIGGAYGIDTYGTVYYLQSFEFI